MGYGAGEPLGTTAGADVVSMGDTGVDGATEAAVVSTGVEGKVGAGWVSTGATGVVAGLRIMSVWGSDKLQYAVGVPGGAVHNGAGMDWLCHGARAVGDGQSSGLKLQR